MFRDTGISTSIASVRLSIIRIFFVVVNGGKNTIRAELVDFTGSILYYLLIGWQYIALLRLLWATVSFVGMRKWLTLFLAITEEVEGLWKRKKFSLFVSQCPALPRMNRPFFFLGPLIDFYAIKAAVQSFIGL